MKPNYAKENHGAFLHSYNQTPCTDTCHNYGSMNGCDEGCPALLRGDCEVPEEAIKSCAVDDAEKAEILSLYNAKGHSTKTAGEMPESKI